MKRTLALTVGLALAAAGTSQAADTDLTLAGPRPQPEAKVVSGRSGPFTIHDAIGQAITTHPGVGEAAANRRATETEMRQVQSTLLPQVRLEARYGPERLTTTPQTLGLAQPIGNGQWLNGRTESVVVRQLIFDGLTTINEIWRQAARVDSAAYRVRERTELLALDAAEAYIDVVRYQRLVALARESLRAHRGILANVQGRFAGGRAGEGDLQQAQERVAATEAIVYQFEQNLDEARGKFRKAVGIEPYNLRFPGRLPGLPANKDESLAVALRHNPTIRAAEAEVQAAKYGYRATAGAFLPQVAFEARALQGFDSDGYVGPRHQESAKVVMTWDIVRGGQDAWRRVEASERMIQQTMAHARLQRDAFESLDRAWAARTITNDRAAALVRDVAASRRVVTAYTKEYELGQRTLIDLLNAQNTLLNAQVNLVSTRSVAVFADYQLLAAMGQMLEYLKSPAPVDSEPLEVKPIGIFPTKLPPYVPLFHEPQTGPEPLNVIAPRLQTELPPIPAASDRFVDRWPSGTPRTAFSYAPEKSGAPFWPIELLP
jgi:adhesin transport system outer membrane protein